MVLELAMCCLNIGQKKAQCTGAYAARFCPEYTLWAEQQASGTCSVVSQIKAVFTSVTRALLRSLLPAEVAQTPPSIFLSASPSSSVTHNLTGQIHDFTEQPRASEQNTSATKL